MAIYKIPVSWEVGGFVEVEAKNVEDAISKIDDHTPLPENGTYIDGSFRVDVEDTDSVEKHSKFYVTFKVDARFVAEVKDATSVEDAIEKARGEYETADFGSIEVVEGKPIIVEDENDIIWEA